MDAPWRRDHEVPLGRAELWPVGIGGVGVVPTWILDLKVGEL